MASTSDGRADPPTLFTVGHSNRSLEGFLDVLRAHRVAWIADVRSAPWSRRHPWFGRDVLEAALAGEGIGYRHLPELGGMRTEIPGSPHCGLPSGGFRGYADHMGSAEFERGVAALLDLAAGARTAALCAEADPSRCHRGLLADALTARSVAVVHLLDASSVRPHALHPAAVVEQGRVAYPGRPDLFDTPRA